MRAQAINKTLDFADLRQPDVRLAAGALRRWVWSWLLSGGRLAVNGHAKRRAYIRPHKMWEYARGLALTGAAPPHRPPGTRLRILDIGGALTAPVLYLASQGDHVLTLDIDDSLVAETNETARRRGLDLEARTTDLAREAASAGDLGAPGGFDRIYCFCVIEHIPEPGQSAIARRMGELLAPGGQLCLTFDFGEGAPTEAPLYTAEHVARIRDAVALPLRGNGDFADNARRFCLDRRHPDRAYTFGSLFFERAAAP